MKSRLIVAAAAILTARLIWMHIIPGWSEISTDFPNYYVAAWAVAHDEPLADLYDASWFQREADRAGIHNQTALFNYFAPFSALVMRPIAGFTPLTAKRIWIVLNLAFFIVIVSLVARHLNAPPMTVLLIALLGGDALGNNFVYGQFYIILTLLLVAAVLWADRRPTLAGWCVSLGAVVKIFPAVILVYFLQKRQWRAVIWGAVGIAALSFVGILAMGWEPHRIFAQEVAPRVLRGEIQDPYNVRWNTFHALLRRALVPEPGLNPHPILDAPLLYFVLRPLFTVVILLLSLNVMASPLITYGVFTTAISLITPSQASYHQFLFFPAIAAAIHRQKDLRLQMVWAGAFALICSNYMGAGVRWDSGPLMVLAFPRVFLVGAFWLAFVRPWRNKRRAIQIVGAAMLVGAISAGFEYRRWIADTADFAVMVQPESSGLMEIRPVVGSGGLTFSSLRPEGYTVFSPAAFGSGIVYESHSAVFGRSPDGARIRGEDLIEPAMGRTSVIAIRRLGIDWAILEWTHQGSWRELFRRQSIIHDPVFSPSGQAIAFSEWVNGRYRISEWRRAQGEFRILLEGDSNYRYPAYRPDGRFIAFSTDESGNWDVGELPLGDGVRKLITRSAANDFMPVYSSDSKQIYFASDRRRGYRFTAIYSIALHEETQ